jgi:WD40 repeat protein/DNA-binding winged helix-turn-helix (wHTH) protein
VALSFGDFAFDQERRQLLRSGQPVPLEAKAFELLGLLLSRRPHALSKAQIRDVLWPGAFVSESALARLVTLLRAACGDDAQAPRFIRTVHGFGYAFSGEAREDRHEPPAGERRAGTVARPYPGLSPFNEADADRFFGREREIEALWDKVRHQKLLAVIGPSGVGKTSLLRAGLIPRRPAEWAAVACSPGGHPFVALGQALAQVLVSDAEAMAELLRGVSDAVQGEEPEGLVSAASRWRRRHPEALLVFDQFEELFTLNVPEVQARFARMLGRLVEDSGVRVVLGLRDDFFMRCGEHPGLQPVFQDVIPLLPPSAEGLKRALREPAAGQGVRFEDDALVEEMTAAVSAERGALPLLAFAASRLWEERDREHCMLTREAYRRIGGMAGALAQHAEATLQRLGAGSEPIVRELFRNLATAEGTRAARGRAELLSIFAPDAMPPEHVLDTLVAARLLTEFEVPERVAAAGTHAPTASTPRIEIVHESLLTHWPRLVRWQTQDADGAQLRDQLRQAAQLWNERGRREELLWTGASYLDYRAWRSCYPGQLSSVEEDFAQAMAGLANRRRRRRRIALATAGAAMAGGLGMLAVLWSRSESARGRAHVEALRAEASKLLALGQTEKERHPTGALAYAIKSLELADTEEARRFALRVMQAGPTALYAPALPEEHASEVDFSPDGRWLSLAGFGTLQLLPSQGEPIAVAGDFATTGWTGVGADFGLGGEVLVGGGIGDIRIWSVPGGRELRRIRLRNGDDQWRYVRGGDVLVLTTVGEGELIERASIRDGQLRFVGSMEALPVKVGQQEPPKAVDAAGAQLAYGLDRRVYVRSLHRWDMAPRLLGTHPAEVVGVAFHPDGKSLVASDRSGQIRLWSTTGTAGPLRVLEAKGTLALSYDRGGDWLGAFGDLDGFLVRLWDLRAPAWAEPLVIRNDATSLSGFAFAPDGQWLTTADSAPEAAFWPLAGAHPLVLRQHEEWVNDVAFSLDGTTLVSASGDGTLRAWSMSPRPGRDRLLLGIPMQMPRIAVDPKGDRVAVSGGRGRVLLVSLAGRPTRELAGFSENALLAAIAFSPDGHYVAAAPLRSPAAEKVIRVWDLESDRVTVLGPFPGAGEGLDGGLRALLFVDADRLVACSLTTGVSLLGLRDGSRRQLSSRPSWAAAVDGRTGGVLALLENPAELVRLDLEGRATPLGAVPLVHGGRSVALDPTGTMIATGGLDGIVRIGPASGGEPHLFFGHHGPIFAVAFSPDGRLLASGADDNTVRVWTVPDVTRTPLHRRRPDEVLANLRSWTNLRVVPDAQSPTGWKLEPGPFPGWAKAPMF